MRLFIFATPLLLVSTALAHPAPLKRDETLSSRDLCPFGGVEQQGELNGAPVKLGTLQGACDMVEAASGEAEPTTVKDVVSGLQPNKRHNVKSNGKTVTSSDAVIPPGLPDQVTSVVNPVEKEVTIPHKRDFESPTENLGGLSIPGDDNLLAELVEKRLSGIPIVGGEFPGMVGKRLSGIPIVGGEFPGMVKKRQPDSDLPMGKMGKSRNEKEVPKKHNVDSKPGNVPVVGKVMGDVAHLTNGHLV